MSKGKQLKGNPNGLQQSKSEPKVFETIATANINKELWLQLAAVGITFIVFFPSLFNGFVLNWDDAFYIKENQTIRALNWANLKIIATGFQIGNYHPLTIVTYALEYAIVGLQPFLYHFDNLLLHLLNVALVFIFTRKLLSNIEIAFITALLFGIHPMHVESVAWVSERKDVLYTLFFLLSAITYLNYFQKTKNQIRNYILSFLFILLSLLSKPAAVCFPGVIILIDWFCNRTFSKKLLLEKVPFVAISVVFGIVAVKSQIAGGAISEIPLFSFSEQVLLSFYAVVLYVSKVFAPIGLSALHPYPPMFNNHFSPIVYLSPIIVLGLLVPVILSLRKTKFFAFCTLFFFVTIVMVLQLLPFGVAIISERYSYIPYIGFFMMLGYGYVWIAEHKNVKIKKLKSITIVVLSIWSLYLGFTTWNRTKVWMRGDYLFEDVLKTYDDEPFIYNNLGYIYSTELQEPEKAIFNYNKCIALKPNFEKAYINRGSQYSKLNQYKEALADYNHILVNDTNNSVALLGRANALSKLNQFDSAILVYNKYLSRNKGTPDVYQWRGFAKYKVGTLDEALADFTKAIKMHQKNFDLYHVLSLIHLEKGMISEAISDISMAITIDPSQYQLYANRGVMNHRIKNEQAAINDYSKALQLNPNDGETYYNRSISYANLKQWKNAIDDMDKAQKLQFPVDKAFYERTKMNAFSQF